ncbi:MAG: Hsp20/alpha crystallin family protein [Proteobacteria bacterium]|nr:Hsp20/alpha crystallin family protein [Pseudomonadota bacterium]
MNTRLSLWRPERSISFRDLNNLQRRFDRLWEDVFVPATSEAQTVVDYVPPCDLEETDSHYVVSLDVPGMSKENLHVEVSGENLIITGSRKEERITKKGEPQISERYQGKFFRSMSFPGLTEESKIEAVYKDGVLRVAIPKAPQAKKKAIEIADEKSSFWSKLLGRVEEKRAEKAA